MKKIVVVLSLIITAAVLCAGCRFGGQDESSVPPAQEQSVESSAEASVMPSAESSEESSEEPSPEPLVLIPSEEDLKSIKDYDSKYYVKKLSDEMKYHFVTLYKAVTNFEKSAELAVPVDGNDVLTLMYLLNYDCPELIHLGGDYGCEYDPDGNVTVVAFTYCIEKSMYKKALEELETARQIILEKTQGKDQLEAEKIIFDHIFYNCVYSEEDATAGSVYGALVKNVARCEGYSKSFEWCMRLLGYECMCVVGSQQWNSTVKYSNHSWNVVKIGEEYYNVDITADNVRTTSAVVNKPLYGFFNANDEMTYYLRDAENVFKELGVPECTALEYNYHIMNGLYIPAGELSEEKIDEIFDRYFTQDGFSGVSIKCGSAEDYKDLCAKIKTITDNYLSARSSYLFTKEYAYNTVSQTVMVSCIPAAASQNGG